MSDGSSIEWLARPGTRPATWNVTFGCTRVSPGCLRCYAERMAGRLAGMAAAEENKRTGDREIKTPASRLGRYPLVVVPGKPRWNNDILICGDAELAEPLGWRTPRTVFVNSMSDLFHPDVPFWFIDRVFAVMAVARRHTFIVLTKRAARMREYFRGAGIDPYAKMPHGIWRQIVKRDPLAEHVITDQNERARGVADTNVYPWPLPNVWLGVSAEDQLRAEERIPELAGTPAAVRFVSYEPALDVVQWLSIAGGDRLDWIIIGCESGPQRRPFNKFCLTRTLQVCKEMQTPLFVKQLPVDGGSVSKNPDEWPEELRVREWPGAEETERRRDVETQC